MTDESSTADDLDADIERRAEQRWPMALAVAATAVLHAMLPMALKLQPEWLFPVIVIAILLVLVAGDPGRIDRRKPWLAVTTGCLIGFITIVNGWAAVQLVVGILDNASFTQPEELLLAGGAVWLTNVIAFALWYWDVDRGGPAERVHNTLRRPAFIFPEMQHPATVEPGWYPKFIDYLTFSFSTATAFSPTDVSAVRPWAKLLMVSEALLSLTLAALVIARAINVLQ